MNRNYGKDRTLGDIIYNPETNAVFCNLDLGVLSLNLTLNKREDGCYDLLKPYTSKNGDTGVMKLGRTFQVTRQDKTVVEGLSRTSLALFSKYNKDSGKNEWQTDDQLQIVTHKLKETVNLGDSGFVKVGWITGKFGIEVDDGQYAAPQQGTATAEEANNVTDMPEEQIQDANQNEDNIPF
ncbi:hypothetical protein HOK00_00830 [bacterium]|jgi:hypothetical protein|nr:hypothetical protein [bacterium]